WLSKTHNFHLSCGEYIITLEDVALQLELSIDGCAIMDISVISESAILCYNLLRVSSGDDESKFMG
ncbi:hypothetical protein J1N35_005646, partial [Gossypium stocksii]